jgi:hypothetical protein
MVTYGPRFDDGLYEGDDKGEGRPITLAGMLAESRSEVKKDAEDITTNENKIRTITKALDPQDRANVKMSNSKPLDSISRINTQKEEESSQVHLIYTNFKSRCLLKFRIYLHVVPYPEHLKTRYQV